jgi:hypothetical protein
VPLGQQGDRAEVDAQLVPSDDLSDRALVSIGECVSTDIALPTKLIPRLQFRIRGSKTYRCKVRGVEHDDLMIDAHRVTLSSDLAGLRSRL